MQSLAAQVRRFPPPYCFVGFPVTMFPPVVCVSMSVPYLMDQAVSRAVRNFMNGLTEGAGSTKVGVWKQTTHTQQLCHSEADALTAIAPQTPRGQGKQSFPTTPPVRGARAVDAITALVIPASNQSGNQRSAPFGGPFLLP